MRKRNLRLMQILLAGGLVAALYASSRPGFSAQPTETSLRFAPPSGWKEDESLDGMRSWLGDPKKRQFISVIEDQYLRGEIPTADDKKFVEQVIIASRFPNWLAGISDWKVDQLERSRHPQGYKVVLVGTYKNSKGELIQFEEWKYYLHGGFGQINFSEVAGAKATERKEIEQILKRYRPLGS